jgi:hypothetical protein
VYPVLINEEMTTKSQWYYCFTRNGENAILKHTGSEAKGSNPTTGLTLLWARNPFRGNSNHWQVSQKQAGQIFFKRRHGCEKGIGLILNDFNCSGLAGGFLNFFKNRNYNPLSANLNSA